jgi:ferredoxin
MGPIDLLTRDDSFEYNESVKRFTKSASSQKARRWILDKQNLRARGNVPAGCATPGGRQIFAVDSQGRDQESRQLHNVHRRQASLVTRLDSTARTVASYNDSDTDMLELPRQQLNNTCVSCACLVYGACAEVHPTDARNGGASGVRALLSAEAFPREDLGSLGAQRSS